MKKRYRKQPAMGIATRKSHDSKNEISTRTISLRFAGDVPATLDEDKRTVEVLASTENPVKMYDWERGMIDEVLLMSGLDMPASRKVPLLDAHSRYATTAVIGSFREMKAENGELNGVAHFSRADDAQGPWTKLQEGHLTDFSVGYQVDRDSAVWIADGETAVIDGREFQGPVKVIRSWKIRELSVVPIGADENAKARTGQPAEPQKKESGVDKKLRAFLERRGLAKDATEAEAWVYLESLEARQEEEVDNSDGEVDLEGEREAAVLSERHRISEISAMGARFDCAELAAGLINDGRSVEQARKAILDRLAEESGTEGGTGHRAPVEVGVDEREKFRDAAESAVLLRAGVPEDKPAAGADVLAGRSMVELSRMALVRAGQQDSGRPIDVVGRALTTSDFPHILSAAANKSLFAGWDTAEETWSTWAGTGAVTDFKTQTSVRAGEADDLDEVPESTEYKYGDRAEAKEEFSIATYGKLFAITRQAIVNDDLSALADVPAMHGEAAARKVGDIAYAVLIANSAMGDGTTLFHADHGNLGSAGVVSTTTLAEAIKLMKVQKDLSDKRRLNIRPQFFISPVALEGSAEVFFRSDMLDATGDTDAVIATANPYSGNYFQRVYEPRLDDDSATAWYLAAAAGKTVKVFFLDGIQAPYMETRQGWSVDGVEYKVRIDAGAKAMDWRGLVKNAGA